MRLHYLVHWLSLAGACFVFCLHAMAGEYVLLSTGFQLRVDRHEAHGDRMILYTNGGTVELPAAQVLGFEPEMKAPEPKTPPPASAAPNPRDLIAEAARRNGLDSVHALRLLEAVARVESGYRMDAVSPKGAIGLMQLMPSTAQELGANPHDPAQNADAGARYLVSLLLRYKDDPWQLRKALAAYNAGPAAVDRYNGVPPYQETVRYVEKVIKQLYSPPR